MINLSKRLEKLSSIIKPSDSFADIGTDHGFVPFYLLENNIVNKAYIADISKKCLAKADKFFAGKFSKRAEFILSDGLKKFDENNIIPDRVLIAGMGGLLISQIISASFELAKRVKEFILQPMQGPEYLREYLLSHGFSIDEEYVIFDKKYYQIMVCHYTGTVQSRKTYIIGENILGDTDDKSSFLEYNIMYRRNIIKELKKSNSMENQRIKDKISLLKNEINIFEEKKFAKNK